MKSRVSILTLFLLCLFTPFAAMAQSSTKVQGLVQNLPATGVLGNWVIGGQFVTVSQGTEIDADADALQLGACVEAEGTLTAGALEADKISVKDEDDCGGVGQTPGSSQIEFTATAQSAPSGGLNGTWTIGTWTVSTDEFTDFDGDEEDFRVGACLEVEGVLLANGIVRASDIETEDADDCTGGGALGNEAELRGVVDLLPSQGSTGDWMIRGFTVRVSETTEINNDDGAAIAGACVKAEGNIDENGVLDARQVRVLLAESCETPNESLIEFRGPIGILPSSGLAGNWSVSGIDVAVSNPTQLHLNLGPAQTGACVEVEGTADMGAVTAREIRVLGLDCTSPGEGQTQVSFEGQVQSIPPQDTAGVWHVSGRTVLVSDATTVNLDGRDPETGSCVAVEGSVITAGTINATSITRLDENCAGSPGLPELVEIVGTIDTIADGGAAGDWVVGGTTITVSDATELNATGGDFTAGGCVRIQGRQSADAVLARELETLAAGECSADGNTESFAGIVTTRPESGQTGDWTISQQQVAVADTTELDTTSGQLGLGSCVEVSGVRGTDGMLTATRIDVQSASGACVLAVVNSGTFRSGAISPGGIVSVFGLGLGPGAGLGIVVENNRVTNNVGGVQVLFDGTPAPILYLSANQVNVVAPYSIAGQSTTTMQVVWAGVFTKTLELEVAEADPALLTLDQSGRGQAAVLNWEEDTQSFTVNGPENPASPGQVVVLFATGEGQTTPAGEDGLVADANNLPRPNADVSVTIGGLPAEVQYAGGAPSLVAGVLQVNTVVPADLAATGDVEVILHVGEFQSPEGVTIFVQP